MLLKKVKVLKIKQLGLGVSVRNLYQVILVDKDIPVIQDKVKINIQSSKKRRSSTKAINFRIPNDVYNDFIKKVDETGLDIDKILLEMIKEWIEQ